MIPNILTTMRIVIIPFFVHSVMTDSYGLAVILLLVSAVTDIADGQIARHFNMITDWGSVYDPLADKLTQIAVVVCLTVKHVLPLWLVCIIAVKEAVMIIVGLLLFTRGKVLHSNLYGKTATVIFYGVILTLIMFPRLTPVLKGMLLAVLAGVFVFAGVGYLLKILGKDKHSLYEERTGE